MPAGHQSLNVLSAAPSKEALAAIVEACFRHRRDLSKFGADARAAELGVDPSEFATAVRTVVDVIGGVLYASAGTPWGPCGGGVYAHVAGGACSIVVPSSCTLASHSCAGT